MSLIWCLAVLKTIHLCHLFKYICLFSLRCHGMCVEVRKLTWFFSHRVESQGLNSSHQVWWQVSFYPESQLLALNLIFFFKFLYADVLSAPCCIWCPQKPKEGFRSPGAAVRDSCEPPCGCWESSLGVAASPIHSSYSSVLLHFYLSQNWLPWCLRQRRAMLEQPFCRYLKDFFSHWQSWKGGTISWWQQCIGDDFQTERSLLIGGLAGWKSLARPF